ncbi:transcription factor-like protein [Perilla frutescens var. hirtella]|uniref:Transcription factor-like protein n=1 Tax=Perilla frutescens var. hirtella TaxID=608512 RepID=A0AAD4P5I5_PERFH|nr:transcription factor-like protein [Perilla frutescens var. hirtella]
MGYLLKEGLKTLCGVNQWSYAVFWKIGCQNPKLLIWEECYYEPASCSGIPGKENPHAAFHNYDASWISAGASNPQAGDKVHLLVNKMMMDNHVNIVGEGLVGRVAFTGNHQWILSENYCGDTHPPEVVKEVCQQFSAGMQTVAVIPVLPHGVVQFGSSLTIMENLGFISDVTSLILQLGYVSGALLSQNYEAKENAPRIGVPVGNFTPRGMSLDSNVINAPCSFDSFNYVGNHSQRSFSLAEEIQNELQLNGAMFQASNSNPDRIRHHHYHQEPKLSLPVKLDQLMNGVAKAEVIPSNSEMWKNQNTSLYMPRSTLGLPSSSSPSLNCGAIRGSDEKILLANVMHALAANTGSMYSSDDGSVARSSVEVNGLCNAKWSAGGNSNSIHPTSIEPKNEKLHKVEPSNSNSVDCFTSNSSLAYSSDSKLHHVDNKFGQSELNDCKKEMGRNTTIQAHDIPLSQIGEHLNMAELIPDFVQDDRKQKFGGQIPYMNNSSYDDVCVQPESGDDLFDVLGADFKNKLFSSCWNSCSNESAPNMHSWDNKNNLPSKKSFASSEVYSASQGNSESGIFSSAGTDHLLEAVVSKIHPSSKQSMDDDVSCRTTLTNMSCSSGPNTSLPYGRFGVSDQLKGELYGVPKFLAKAGAMSSCSLITGSSKEESRSYSQGSSIYGQQMSSWMEKADQKAKPSNSVSTGHSKKPDESGKANRKRLKPGENPRPRPKDRQMIQDRVKELREIVPNGAKCSIDALLERTIKHMLFLQSVTKHADKLKQPGESKIISKDGGLVLKDNFEGGATWAYEVGSQSMVCPIIVEDLNQPRQMLVEMLCEERGLFLEIADIIRGLGLTILKGVMETRNDKIWARFAVEANRDVTRMEIFISLVRLLEQSSKGGVSVPQPIA